MQLHSDTLAELIEPTLHALRQPTGQRLSPLLVKAKESVVRARAALRNNGPVHPPSFELGVASAFTQLLSTASQRSVLSDAMAAVTALPKGIETLHQVALINRSAPIATQGDLADRIGMDRGNFNRRIRRLKEDGLVESQRRGQALVYSLTPLGMDVLTEIRPGWRALHPSTLATVHTEEHATELARNMAGALQHEIARRNQGQWTFNVRDLLNREFQAFYTDVGLKSREERRPTIEPDLSFERVA